MATVSHYDMQPYPTRYGGSSTQLTSSQYYVASNQQLSQMYDKTKKTWSQRLKITKTEKSASPLSELPDYSQSALSRSMKYAEPWLYGTVRGIPAPQVHGQAIFTPIPTEVAVVVCSCPEFLNGTKKEVKKASVCKKCKGSRLPFAPIGGTVRLRPTSAPIIHAPRGSAGTVRLPTSSSIKSRPSILDPKNDPYDLMRRSRLVSPEPKQIVDKALKLRAKSVSPTRGRSRNRPTSIRQDDLAPKNNVAPPNNGTGSIRHRNNLRLKSERWLESIEHDPGGRKSILQCNVNPYDLISTKSQTNNEFAPEQEDMFLPSPRMESAPKISPSVKAISGQHISFGETVTKNQDISKFIQSSSESKEISRKTDGSVKQQIKQQEEVAEFNSKAIGEPNQPKRPPRKKQDNNFNEEDAIERSETSRIEANQKTISKAIATPNTLTLPIESVIVTSPTGMQGIKSILKRPSPLTPSPSDIDAKNNELDTAATSSDNSGNKTLSPGTADIATPFGQSAPSTERPPRSVSQFYLPLPQTRKKVQFLVENRIIYRETAGEPTTMQTSVQDIASVRRDEPNTTLKRKHPQTNTTTANSECKDGSGLKNSSSIAQKQNDQGVDSISCERKQYQIPLHLEIQSGKEPHKRLSNENSNNLQATTITNSAKDVRETHAMANGTEQNNSDFKISCFDPEQAQENCNGRIALDEDDRGENCNHREDSDSFDSGPISVDATALSSSANRRVASLRRTHSARSNHTTTIFLNFNDTMALRVKNARPDSRDIFSENGGSQPSPQPTSLSAAKAPKPGEYPTELRQLSLRQEGTDSMSSAHANVIPSRVTKAVVSSMPLPTDAVTDYSPPADRNLSTGTDDRNLARNKMQQQKMEQNFETKENSRVVVVDCVPATQPARPPRQVNKKISWQEENEGNVAVKNEPEDKPLKNNDESVIDGENSGFNKCAKTIADMELFNKDKDGRVVKANNFMSTHNDITQEQNQAVEMMKEAKLLQARNELLIGSRLFGNTPDKSVQKTIVKVAPFNKNGSQIHRLKILHEDESRPLNFIPQKKTSIMINGDNCYSTVNVSTDTPLYQSSVVVNNGASTIFTEPLKPYANTVTINVSNPSTPEDEINLKNNKINSLLSLNNGYLSADSSSSTVSPSCSSSTVSDGDSSSCSSSLKRGSTLITLGSRGSDISECNKRAFEHEQELVKILRNPVEAVRRNLVPHICGKSESPQANDSPPSTPTSTLDRSGTNSSNKLYSSSFIGKLLEDPTLHQVAEGLENDVMVRLIESSLKRLKESRQSVDTSGTKDNDDMNKLIDLALQKVSEERVKIETKKQTDAACDSAAIFQHDHHENGSISSGNSYGSANYDLFDFDNNESDCYQSCSSEMTTEEDAQSTRSKFYQMLVDATLSEIEISTNNDDDHHYESIKVNCDPIYEEISDVPPPLPLSSPPIGEGESEKKGAKSMFEGASKYDILSYLVDAKERGLVREEPYEYNFSNMSEIIVEEEVDTLTDLNKSKINDISSRVSHLSVTSDSSEEISLNSSINDKLTQRRPNTEVERNDSGVGSETSKSSRSKYLNSTASSVVSKNSPVHLCEDCDGPVETQVTESGVMYAPLVCRKCSKKRAERKEIIIEIVETEEKYGRDLQIILEEFCKPMLVAGLLTQEQLSAIFLNTEELLENNQTLAEKMRDALDIATEQGDDDFLTVNVGKVFLEATPMLHAFESYCVRQAAASLLLANLEKDKELLRIFLRVSQMENAVLRRMNLNSFLMVPVQRVTKYPLLLARLYKVTPAHLQSRPLLKQAQEKIELHLNHMNQEAKDVPTKLWRRISSSSPNRRLSCEIDMINIKLRKLAIDVLEWNHDEVRFAMEGKLLFTQPTDNNWKKARTIKLTHVNALLVTNGKPSANYKPDRAIADQLSFPKHTGIREASLLMVKEKCGRYTLLREPLYMDRCIVCTEADWDDYFEVHEISSKDTFIFKAEDGTRTKQWYTQLQYHSQGMGAWRKRRNALANIMINGMLSRT